MSKKSSNDYYTIIRKRYGKVYSHFNCNIETEFIEQREIPADAPIYSIGYKSVDQKNELGIGFHTVFMDNSMFNKDDNTIKEYIINEIKHNFSDRNYKLFDTLKKAEKCLYQINTSGKNSGFDTGLCDYEIIHIE